MARTLLWLHEQLLAERGVGCKGKQFWLSVHLSCNSDLKKFSEIVANAAIFTVTIWLCVLKKNWLAECYNAQMKPTNYIGYAFAKT